MKDVKQMYVEAGVETTFDMKLQRSQFLVKNFTDGNIKVQLGCNEEYSTIGPKCWEHIFNNVNNAKGDTIPTVTNVVLITADMAGLVEVASID